jgi:hypothetical protein
MGEKAIPMNESGEDFRMGRKIPISPALPEC